MKKHIYRALSVALCLLMLTGILPAGLEMKASAGVANYCATAAAQWAEEHWNDVYSVLVGKGYFAPKDGGDCANFVSQCIYMGGIDMTTRWNSAGYLAHYSTASDGAFIRAHQLYNYVVSLGGQSIQNPSASDVSVGDLLFYKTRNDGRMHHSAIVVAIENGNPIIAAHSTMNNGVEVRYRTADWHCNMSGDRTFLVKMNGSLCYASNPRIFDVYTAKSGGALYYGTSTTSGRIYKYLSGEYTHVYEVRNVGGVNWGRTQRYGRWGWVKLSSFNYQTHIESYRPSHIFGNWYVVKESNCRENGYEQRVCQRCGYTEKRTITGGHKVTKEPTCLSGSFCDYCGIKIKDALGHNFADWEYVVKPTCLETGSEKRVCKRCGYTETRDVPALGHDYQPSASAPSCLQTGTQTYKCTRCGDSYIQPVDKDNPWSDWTTDVLDLPEGKVRSKTQYRYSDKQTTTSYDTSKSGWTQDGGSWVQSGSGGFRFVYSFPSSYDTGNMTYKNYNRQPLNSYETTTDKRVVNISDNGTNIYWHWCKNEHDGTSCNFNHKINYTKEGPYTQFHVIETTNSLPFNSNSGFNVFIHADGYYCNGTKYWYGNGQYVNAPIDVYNCNYTDYKKLFNYYKWTDWSDWQDEAVTATSTRKVETRTVYSYDLAALGHDWAPVKQNATCTEKGYEGNICRRCGARDIKDIAPLGHDMPDWEQNRDEWYKISKDGENPIVYRADCRRNCGYFETREESGCQYVVSKVVDPTCTKDGYTIYKCKVHANETKKDNIVPALGHEADNNWYTTKGATCTEAGEETCKCVRHDNGVTCDKLFTREVPAKGHKYVHFDMVDATCVDDGMKEYYKCSECKELFDADKNSTTEKKLVIPAKGHVPGDWIRTAEPGCGKTGWEEKHCTVCDVLLDEREIPGWEHEFKVTEDVESTCIEPGYTIYTCTKCGEQESELKNLKDHTWGEWDVKDTICIYPGEKTRECTYCHIEEFEEIPAKYTEHDLREVTASDGCKAYECTRCDYKEDGSHKFVRDTANDIKPTCTESGREAYKCSVCSAVKYVEIPETGHDYKETESVAATCVTPGYTLMVCANNSSHRYNKETSQPLGHDYDYSSPKSNSDKTHSYECKRSGCTSDTYNHFYTEDCKFTSVTVEPTCLNKGFTSYTCSECGYSYNDDFKNALGHDYSEWKDNGNGKDHTKECMRTNCTASISGHSVTDVHHMKETERVSADCTHDGYYIEVCSDCGYTLKTVIKAHGHTEVVDSAKAATCTETGLTEGKHCSVCNTVLVKQNVTPALGHDWDEGRITKNATCTVDGVKTFTCKRDSSHTYTEAVKAKGHTEVIDPAKSAACTETGLTEGKHCSVCNEVLVKQNVTPALGHDWDEGKITKDSTCTLEGVKTFTCKRDSSHTYTEAVSAKGHKKSDWIIDKEPDCVNEGDKHIECTVCGTIIEEAKIPAKGHTAVVDSAKPATCTETGLTEGKHCSVCNTVLVKQNVTPALGHDWDEGKITKDPTCTLEGVKTFTCKRDSSHTYTEAVKAKGHTEVIDPAKSAACTETGLTEGKHCSVCNEILVKQNVTPVLGHDWDEGKITKDPTCTLEGVKTFTCKRDSSHMYTEAVPANGHTKSDWITDKEPDCVNEGDKHIECTVCGTVIEEGKIPAKGHVEAVDPAKDATCTETGLTEGKHCSVCNAVLVKQDEVPALGHEYGAWYTVTEATYASDGLERRDCVRSDVFETRVIPMKIRHKATFIADGKIIDVVEFEDGAASINEPAVPAKDRYTAKWEDYVLEDKDITVNAEYTLIPSDGSSQIETDKTAEYDPETGDTVIRLTASSDAKTVISKTVKGKPLDIVLVVDQSGSMAGNRTEALKKAAENFINTVGKNAVETDTDHRIAIVGFAMGRTSDFRGYAPYLNTGILTAPGGYVQMNNKNLTSAQKRDSLVSVKTSDGKINPVLTNAVSKIQASGATAADLGLEMANDIFSLNSAEGRKRVIVFMTDGDPTYASNFDNGVANTAIEQARLAKNANGAVIYGLNIENYNSRNSKNFINYVSSNYPGASSMNNAGKKTSDKYYLEVKDVSSLNSIFETIAEETLVNTTDFKDVTIIDTVSKYFTLTTAQEKTLKENAIKSLGVKYEDITVTRNSDGTTVIRIDHVDPVETTVNGKTKYVADFSFTVTANENALNKGTYKTNTEDAGILMPGSDSYEKVFLSPSVRISDDHVSAIFKINGEVFHIVNVLAGAEIKAPEFKVESGYTFSGWNVPDGYTLDGGYVVFDSTLTRAKHTVTWITDSGSQTDTLFVGDRITPPEPGVNSEGLAFAGWDSDVPDYMPDSDLTFTAVYGEHEHKYVVKSTTPATCVKNGETVYECEICSETYSETIECVGHHNYYALVGPAGTELSKTTFKCSTCGEDLKASLSYEFVSERRDYRGEIRSTTYDMFMTDETGIEVRPDGSVTISAVLSNYYPGRNSEISVRRYNPDGTYDILPCTVKDGIVTFTTDHFCNFEFVISADCENGGRHEDYDKDGVCDKCGKEVTKADLFRCSMCPIYEKMKDVPVVGIIYAVVHFFIHLAAMISWIT